MPMAFREHAADQGRLQEWTLAAVLGVSREKPSLMEALRRDFGPLLARIEAQAEGDSLPVLETRRLCTRAIALLWAEENRGRGKGRVRPSDWRVMLYSMSSARTVREAILRCADCYEVMDGRAGTLNLRVRDGRAELIFGGLSSLRSLGSVLVSLFGVAEFHSLIQWLMGQPFRLSRICLDNGPDLFGGSGRPPLPFPLELNAGWSGFAFPAAVLDYPVDQDAPSLFDRPGGTFLFGAEDDPSQDDLSEQVRRIAMRSLRVDLHLPSLAEVAKSASLSPATLRRRLGDRDTSYREIKESCRRELSLKLLRHSSLTIEDIAARLDYCDSDTFRRAFRDWMGASPSQFRRNLPTSM